MKYFLFDAERAHEIDLADSNEITSADATNLLYHLSEEEGSFLGLQNPQGVILQFAWERLDEWLVDMPFNGGKTYQLFCDFNKCTTIIAAFFEERNVPYAFGMKLNDI